MTEVVTAETETGAVAGLSDTVIYGIIAGAAALVLMAICYCVVKIRSAERKRLLDAATRMRDQRERIERKQEKQVERIKRKQQKALDKENGVDFDVVTMDGASEYSKVGYKRPAAKFDPKAKTFGRKDSVLDAYEHVANDDSHEEIPGGPVRASVKRQSLQVSPRQSSKLEMGPIKGGGLGTSKASQRKSANIEFGFKAKLKKSRDGQFTGPASPKTPKRASSVIGRPSGEFQGSSVGGLRPMRRPNEL